MSIGFTRAASAALVICADEVEARAREAQDRLGFEECTTDWKQVVAHPLVQVVSVASPNHLHLEMVRLATRERKHVFCEKPVGCNSGETAAIARLAREARVLSWVGYNYRWAPVVQYAREVIESGKLGSITHYRGRFLVDYGSNPDGVLSWRFQRELAGHGTLSDLMSHVVDMAHMLAGPIRRVVGNQKTFITTRPVAIPGQGTHFSVNTDCTTAAMSPTKTMSGHSFGFACGAWGSLEVCRVAKGPRCEMAFEINGTQGAIQWNYERMNELWLFLPDGTDEHDGPVLIQAGPAHPAFSAFYPGPGNSMSYEDLKIIETFQFLQVGRRGKARQSRVLPGVERGRLIQDALARSWASKRWETVQCPRRRSVGSFPLRKGGRESRGLSDDAALGRSVIGSKQ